MTDAGELPHAEEAERAVLGSALLDAEALVVAKRTLTAADFYRPAHRLIYQAMLAASQTGTPIDPVSLGEILADTGDSSCSTQTMCGTSWNPSRAHGKRIAGDDHDRC